MDFGIVAHSAMTLLLPYLLHAGGKMAEGAEGDAGKKLFQWIQERWKRSEADSAVLANAAKRPEDPGNVRALELKIITMLRDDEQFRRELLAALPPDTGTMRHRQAANITGDNNIIGQVQGSRISQKIG